MKIIKKIASIVLGFLLLASIFIIWFQRQSIQDWYRLRDYNPPTAVIELADNTTMTSEGRRLFYINQPIIATEVEFNEVCGRETSIVLGCYISNKGIYIFNVTDPRLSGVKEATAAHEMLHAVYDRLSSSERQRIDGLTMAAYNNITNKRIRENVERYKEQDPSIVPNELHSILPTEVRELPPELEAYYKKYFENRQRIVDYADKYESEFDLRVAKGEQIKQQLDALKQEINNKQTELNLQRNAIETNRRNLDSLRSAGRYEEYNAQVNEFNNQVIAYNNEIKFITKDIERYNQLVADLQALQVEISDLYNVIDSRPQNL